MSAAVPEGQTMNTDQRLALLLTGTGQNSDRELNRLRDEVRYWKDQPGGEAMTEILTRQRAHIGAIGERLEEIISALASGRLRIEEVTA